eukprot:439162-Prorocentrum_minimum.AAC.2
MVVHIQYEEHNLGQQFANATFARLPTLGWTNRILYDGVLLANSTGRDFLAAGAVREIDVSQDYGLIKFTPLPNLDLAEHNLTLQLDINHEVRRTRGVVLFRRTK